MHFTLQNNSSKAEEDGQTNHQETAQEGGGGAVAAEKVALDLYYGPEDVQYASIDFSVMKRNRSREATKLLENTGTEYAEVKTEAKEERDDGAEAEVLGDKEEETKQCSPEEEEGADMAVYSNVTDIMSEI